MNNFIENLRKIRKKRRSTKIINFVSPRSITSRRIDRGVYQKGDKMDLVFAFAIGQIFAIGAGIWTIYFGY